VRAAWLFKSLVLFFFSCSLLFFHFFRDKKHACQPFPQNLHVIGVYNFIEITEYTKPPS